MLQRAATTTTSYDHADAGGTTTLRGTLATDPAGASRTSCTPRATCSSSSAYMPALACSRSNLFATSASTIDTARSSTRSGMLTSASTLYNAITSVFVTSAATIVDAPTASTGSFVSSSTSTGLPAASSASGTFGYFPRSSASSPAAMLCTTAMLYTTAMLWTTIASSWISYDSLHGGPSCTNNLGT